ncbi:hypothetical protein QVD17_01161 [Tagetes erecta]|uniref:Uncharacterized protein n=1 Tax=Tagetes erecta TaxID=13708 RepID=A0AAD8L730_TARER|nr:hypothetical protein QVD17_01161 [Tagetes erecta]
MASASSDMVGDGGWRGWWDTASASSKMVGYGVSLVEDGGIRRSLVEDGGLRRLRSWMAAADGGVVVAGQGCEGMWKKGMGKKG